MAQGSTKNTVTLGAALPAGTNNIGDVDVLTLPALPAGTNNIGDVDVLSLPALPAGSNNIGDVDVLTVPADPFGANADAIVAAGATGSLSAKLRRATQGLEDLKTLIVLGAGTNAIGKLAANSGVDIGDVDVTSITPPTLTKGTQGATGFSTQALKDAGRTHVNYYAVAAAAGATTVETAITLTKSSGTAATSTATSFVVTSGKRFRITSLSFATRGHATATIQTTTFSLRINTAGAVTTSSTPIVLQARSATPATASAWDRVIVPIPDGFEIIGDGTLQFGVTANATYTTNAPTWDITLTGFEY